MFSETKSTLNKKIQYNVHSVLDQTKTFVIIRRAHVNNGLFKSFKSSRIKWKGWVKHNNIYVTSLKFFPNEINFLKMILKMVLSRY